MDLLMQGIVLMVIGMATVFAFLILLVFAMNRSAAFFRKFAHLFPEESVGEPAGSDPVAEIAVALAAIKAKRG
jgi:sodium pump decarboxylase gamma subunit